MLKNKLFLNCLIIWAKIVTWFYQQKNIDNKIEPCFNETSSLVFLGCNETARGRCLHHPLVPTKNGSDIG